MDDPVILSRRRMLTLGAAGAGGLLLSGCDKLNASDGFRNGLKGATGLTMRTQRFLLGNALAPEFTEAQMSPNFRVNGNSSATSVSACTCGAAAAGGAGDLPHAVNMSKPTPPQSMKIFICLSPWTQAGSLRAQAAAVRIHHQAQDVHQRD